MKPNFNEMNTPDLRAYVLEHRHDDEAIRILFSRRSNGMHVIQYPPICTPEGEPIEENIRIMEEAIRKRAEEDRS